MLGGYKKAYIEREYRTKWTLGAENLLLMGPREQLIRSIKQLWPKQRIP